MQICSHICIIYVSLYSFTYLYIFIQTYLFKKIYYILDIYIYIYIYTRNAWALTERCSVEGSRSQSNVVATLQSIAKISKVLGNIKIPPPLNFTFNWENQPKY